MNVIQIKGALMLVSSTKSGALALFNFKAFSLSLLLSFFLSFSLIGCSGDGGGGSSGGDDGIDMTIITGNAHSFALSNDGKVYAAGLNNYSQLGLGDTTDHIDFTEVTSISGVGAIAAGDLYSFALSNDGKVYATGKNNYGQLGLGDWTDRSNFTEVGF
jgi:hypothetical protein